MAGAFACRRTLSAPPCRGEACRGGSVTKIFSRRFNRLHPNPPPLPPRHATVLIANCISLMASQKQVAANQSNAQLSTGPSSETGKARSSLNALKTGLTGRTVLLPGEDVSAFEALRARLFEYFDPTGYDETELVHRLAETRWRLTRCSALETNLFALGQVEFAALYEAEAEEVRPALIQAHTFRAYQKEFRNLGIQEGRLQRLCDRTLKELREVQEISWEREDQQAAADPCPAEPGRPLGTQRSGSSGELPAELIEYEFREAAKLYLAFQKEGRPFDPAQFGFEFSTHQLEEFLQSQPSAQATGAVVRVPDSAQATGAVVRVPDSAQAIGAVVRAPDQDLAA